MLEKLTILICLYNKKIDESCTITSLIKNKIPEDFISIVLWDNSSTKLDDISIVLLKKKFKKFQYYHTPQNLSLSKIYNNVISYLKKDSYLMICDHDTLIPKLYFEILKSQILIYPNEDLFLPKIYESSKIISPKKNYYIKTVNIKNLNCGVISAKNTIAINSGMVISNRFFMKGFRYNEKLNFYGTDTYFMNEFIKYKDTLVILDVKLKHSLTFNETDDIDKKIEIFKEILRSNSIVYSKSLIKFQLVKLNNLIVAVKFCLKYKTFKFLFLD